MSISRKLFARSLTTSASSLAKLAASAPFHQYYVLLHTAQPPSTYPAKMSTEVARQLQLRMTASGWTGFVNFSWQQDQRAHEQHAIGVYSATAYSTAGGRLEIPEISIENLEEVAKRVEDYVSGRTSGVASDELHLYVCTHGERDCRCGEMGGSVVKALREEVEARQKKDPNGPIAKIKVGEVGHVGGHQWAANLLAYPLGEWFGLLTPVDVPKILDIVTSIPWKPLTAQDPPLHSSHWRGRMGLSKTDQQELHSSHTS